MQALSRCSRPRRGQATVELALVLPLCLWLMLGVIDFGRVVHLYVGATNAAREGARYCSLYPADTAANLAARVKDDPVGAPGAATNPSLPDRSELGGRFPTATISAWLEASATASATDPSARCPNAQDGRDVTVEVADNFHPITPFITRITGSPIAVRASATMVVFRASTS